MDVGASDQRKSISGHLLVFEWIAPYLVREYAQEKIRVRGSESHACAVESLVILASDHDMSSIHIFVGAPSRRDVGRSSCQTYSWETDNVRPTPTPTPPSELERVFPPPGTLAAAGRRLSSIYGNMIFQDIEGDDPGPEGGDVSLGEHGSSPVRLLLRVTLTNRAGATTFMTWASTPFTKAQKRTEDDLTFLRTRSIIDADRDVHTQGTGDGTYDITDSYEVSASYSDASSIGRLPTFHFSLHNLTSMSQLAAEAAAARPKTSKKISMLVAALEVEGLDAITIKKGSDAGKEVSLLKLVVGDETGAGKLAAWREVAEAWGGSNRGRAVQRGDIVLLESKCSPLGNTRSG
jgi:hypothetical protein